MKKLSILILGLFVIAGFTFAQSITVTSPNGGENWDLGTTHNVTWTSIGMTGNVGIKLFQNGASIGYVAENIPVSAGTYSWTISNVIAVGPISAGSNYQIQIKQSGVANDLSDGNFVISPGSTPAASITVLSPNGGETLTRGNNFSISWTSSGVSGNVNLILLKGGSNLGQIVQNKPANGSYSWPVGDALVNPPGVTYPDGSDYRVMVKSVDDGTISDESNGNFVISPKPVSQTSITSQMNINTKISKESVTIVPRPNLKLQNDMDGWVPGKCNYWKFAVDIKNIGKATAQNIPFRFEINGPPGTAFDNFVRNGTLSSCLTIAPDATCKFARTYRINEPGIYYYTFKIDPNNSNNLYKKVTGQFVQQRPDFIVFISAHRLTTRIFKLSVSFYVKNRGTACSKPSVLRTYIKQKGATTHNIPSLRPGDIYLVKRNNIRWPTVGSKKITAAADYTNTNNEGQSRFENNNTDETSVKVKRFLQRGKGDSHEPRQFPPDFFKYSRIINE